MKQVSILFIFAGCLAVQSPAQVTVNNGNSSFAKSVTLGACGDPVTDSRDGKIYSTVLLGTQCWMGQNLNIGIMIPGDQEQTNHNVIEKYCHSDDAANCTVYGGLYSWDNMMQWSTVPGVRGICPAGWHIPAPAEWDPFINFLGGLAVAGGKLKEAGFGHWADPNTGATNSSGFTALPAGSRSYSPYTGWFHNLYNGAYFWLYQDGISTAWFWQLYNWGEPMLTGWTDKSLGFSVRCIKDVPPPVPENRTIKNINIPGGYDSCYDASYTITVAGDGTTFTIRNEGSATMIAGHNILYYPGTAVISGGHLLGRIAPTGPYCESSSMPAVITSQQEQSTGTEQSSFSVYPNPTTGNFILELQGEGAADKVIVTVFGMLGENVLTAVLQGELRHEFLLSDKPEGVYFIRVVSGSISETAKIIKR